MKKNICKLLVFSLILSMILLTFSGCLSEEKVSDTSKDKQQVKMLVIKGPSGIGAVNLMESNEKNITRNKYDIETVTDPQVIVAKLTKGEIDIAAAPTNLAANLYNKDSNLQMLALTAKGVLYFLENGNKVEKIDDLKGKTIYSTGQGSNPQYILEYLLTQNGLDIEKDVNIIYEQQNDVLATKIISGDVEIAMVPEPFVTNIITQNKDVRIALDVSREWDKLSQGKSPLLMSCMVARKDFIKENPKAIENFMKDYEESITATSENVENTARLCEKHEIIPKAEIAKQAIPRSNITWIQGKDMQTEVKGYFEVLLKANAKAIGGKLPDEDFYFGAGK